MSRDNFYAKVVAGNVADDGAWDQAVRDSLYKDTPDGASVKVNGGALRSFWERLQDVSVADLTRGVIA